MRCEDAQRVLSARLDGEVDETPPDADDASPDVEVHVAGCADCRAFVAGIEDVRRRLRVRAIGPVPDVSAAVTAGLDARRRRAVRWFEVAAAVVVGAVLSAAVFGIGDGSDRRVAVAEIPERVLVAQHQVDTLEATVSVVERGWHPDVPERRFSGSLAYRAPESLALRLADDTTYPSAAWQPAPLDVVVAEDRSWSRGARVCPIAALPGCTPAEPRARVVEGREPFSEPDPVPLDLVVPVASFHHAESPPVVGEGHVDGRAAMAVEVLAAQATPVLAAFRASGNLREVHATDAVTLWLDADALVPLRVVVTASGDPDRVRWTAARGYGDEPGDVVLDVTLRDVVLGASIDDDRFAPSPGDGAHAPPVAHADAGFRDGAGGPPVPVPTDLPDGLRPHRDGSTTTGKGGGIGVRSWSDGRGWVKVRATTGWPGGRLFGDLGDGARPMALDNGVAYLDAAGTKVAIHAEDLDLVVTGSLALDELLAVAGSLPVTGVAVPDRWAEASTVDVRGAARTVPGLLLPGDLVGFSGPGLRMDDGYVVATFGGPGARSFTLTQGPGRSLGPPLDVDTRSVTVRGIVGRWSPSRRELEWVEGDLVLGLRSATLGLGELVEVAALLEPA